ncbi:hypothetical protein ACFQZS_16005 [Mucilaginibacter calamicampi]|uniref:Outer membrane protein TolC n=1 Tax=Mucilaginibacter calamicampi TaxID=1302352 RepID=A0ABW2Z4L4_9SPHI
MKPKHIWLLLIAFALSPFSLHAQSISSETVDFQYLKQPQVALDESVRSFKVTVTSPYNLTAEDVVRIAKAKFQSEVNNYSATVINSEKEYQQKLKDYDAEVAKAKEKFAIESEQFKKYSILERLSLTNDNKNPKLVLPAKPGYVKPAPPVYVEPDLNNYTIVDNNVLASQISLSGFTRGAADIDINVDIKAVNFQDNAGQTFANQPTKLSIKIKGVEKVNTTFFQDYTFLSSSPTNNIDKQAEEKNSLTKVIRFLNDYINNMYGFQAIPKTVKILSVKNKGKFDDLERADIYVKTNLRKLQPTNSEINSAAFANMQKGIDIWVQTLAKIEYKNDKADFNDKIAKYIYFNLINLNIALNKLAEAEKYLNALQENLVYIKLSYDENNDLKRMEKNIYQNKK